MIHVIAVPVLCAACLYVGYKYGARAVASVKAELNVVKAKYEAVKAEVASIEGEVKQRVDSVPVEVKAYLARIKGRL